MKYKSAISLIAAALLFPVATAAQFRYGVRIGGDINTSSLSGGEVFSLSRRSGFSGGLTCEYQLPANGFAFGGSILYTRTGVFLKGEGATGIGKAATGSDFLQIPLHAKYKFWMKGIKDLAGPYLYTGPTLLLRLDSDDASLPFTTDRAQPGWDVGIGFDIINFLQISAGYRFGLTNIIADRQNILPQNMRIRNDGVNISVAILFDI